MQKDAWRISLTLQYVPDDFQLYINFQRYLFLLTGPVVSFSDVFKARQNKQTDKKTKKQT